MTNRNEYIAENEAHADSKVIAALKGMTDEEFDIVTEICEDYIGDDIAFDSREITFTQEQLSDWTASSKKWNECGSCEHISSNALFFDGVQVEKGMQRIAIIVVNTGDRRIAISA